MERDKRGRFVKGNPGEPGRPRREVEEQYLNATLTRAPVDKWPRVIDKALEQAVAGDGEARRWRAEHLIGKPASGSYEITLSEFRLKAANRQLRSIPAARSEPIFV